MVMDCPFFSKMIGTHQKIYKSRHILSQTLMEPALIRINVHTQVHTLTNTVRPALIRVLLYLQESVSKCLHFFLGTYHFLYCICQAHLLHNTSYSVFYTVSVNLTKIEVSLFGDDLSLILNIGFLLTLIYALFYICFDVKAGSLAAFFCFICWVFSSYLASLMGLSLAWKVNFFVLFLIMWHIFIWVLFWVSN